MVAAVRSGALRHKIVIQQRSVAKDSYGEDIVTWINFASVWASVEPLNGRELWLAQSVHAETTGRITIRYISGIDATMRVSHLGKQYNINAIIDPELRHRELQLLVSEGVNNG